MVWALTMTHCWTVKLGVYLHWITHVGRCGAIHWATVPRAQIREGGVDVGTVGMDPGRINTEHIVSLSDRPARFSISQRVGPISAGVSSRSMDFLQDLVLGWRPRALHATHSTQHPLDRLSIVVQISNINVVAIASALHMQQNSTSSPLLDHSDALL